jgi:hypothetical protein
MDVDERYPLQMSCSDLHSSFSTLAGFRTPPKSATCSLIEMTGMDITTQARIFSMSVMYLTCIPRASLTY